MSSALATVRRTGEWLAEPGFGVYVHIPFCLHRCHYCDFNTYEGLEDLHRPYVDALVADIERWSGPARSAASVFFGGGTPTLLAPEQLGRIVAAVRARVGIEDDAEITVECNPETVDERRFGKLLDAGFNRFSVGVQSLAPAVLERLGRRHSVQVAVAALAAARRAGVEDLNADLIYGSPWERAEDWRRSLEGILELRPDHISAYALTVEENTPLHTMIATGRVPDVDPDVQAERHAVACDALGPAGYERYEVSNWATPGRASRHNVLYWSAGDYLAFGAGAHGHLDGRRWWVTRLPRDFIAGVAGGRTVEAGHEVVEPDRRGPEALMLGLRLASGVHVESFDVRFGAGCLRERAAVLAQLEAGGAIERADGWLRLAPAATMVANDIVCRLL
ncbi:MAG: radical SAM family heme chaperone HemW [Actinomycetota bacterium]